MSVSVEPHVDLRDLTSPEQVQDFTKFCNDVANAVGPSLVFSTGQVRLGMTYQMIDLYKKYVTKETT